MAGRSRFVFCLALAGILAWPSVAIAASNELTQSVEYGPADVRPTFQEVIEQDGYTYRLVRVDTVEVSRVADTAWFTREYERSCGLDELPGVIEGLDGAVEIDEDGYAGSIGLAEVVSEEVWGTHAEKVERTHTYGGLETNDAAYLPEEETLDMGIAEVTLKRAGASFEVESADELGRPLSWRATCLFRGLFEYDELVGYVVCARYAGEVRSVAEHVTYKDVATYAQAGAPELPTLPLEDKGDAGIPWQVVAATGAGVAAAAGAGALFVVYWRRGRLGCVWVDADGCEMRASAAPIEEADHRLRCVLQEGMCEGAVSARGYVPWRYLGAGYEIEVVGPNGEAYYRGPTQRVVEFDLSGKERK